MKNIRYTTRLIKAFISRFKGLLLLGVLFGILAFFFFRVISPKLFGKSVEKIGITGRFDINTLPSEILEQIGMGLTQLDETGIPQPGVAKSWSTTDGGRTWEFILDGEALWQDGEEDNNRIN